MANRFVPSDAWAMRLGMAAAGMLFGLAVALTVALVLVASGYSGVSLARSVLGGGLIGIASGLVYPAEVGCLLEGALHFAFGAVGTAAGQPSESAEQSAPWLKRAAQAGSLFAVIGLVVLTLFL